MQLAKGAIKLVAPDGGLEIRTYAHNPNWVFDRKIDGTRVIAQKNDGVVTLFGRGSRAVEGGREQTIYNKQFPELVSALENVEWDNFILDGEAVVLMENGFEDFGLVQKRTTRKHKIEEIAEEYPITFFVFDIPYSELGSGDLKDEPFHHRRHILEEIFKMHFIQPGTVRLLELYETVDTKKELIRTVLENNLEGLLIKDNKSKYTETHSKSWIKAKRVFTEDLFVMGYTKGTGRREKWFGALHAYKMVDGVPIWVTDVGGGLDDVKLDFFTTFEDQLPILEGEEAVAYYNRRRADDRIKVIEIEHYGTIRTGRRHPNMLRFRNDKDPEDCTGESK